MKRKKIIFAVLPLFGLLLSSCGVGVDRPSIPEDFSNTPNSTDEESGNSENGESEDGSQASTTENSSTSSNEGESLESEEETSSSSNPVAQTVTITWLNYDGNSLKVDKITRGDTPEYTGAAPTKPDDESNSYVFSGWTPTVVPATTNAQYMATFNSVPKGYRVRWMNHDGSQQIEEDVGVQNNEHPHYDGDTPTRAEDNTYTYSFKGWSNTVGGNLIDISSYQVHSDVTFYSTFNSSYKNYQVRYQLNNGQADIVQNYHYNDSLLAPVNPTKTGTHRYDSYTFSAWNPSLTNKVTSEATYSAQYDYSYSNESYRGKTLIYSNNFENLSLNDTSDAVYHNSNFYSATGNPFVIVSNNNSKALKVYNTAINPGGINRLTSLVAGRRYELSMDLEMHFSSTGFFSMDYLNPSSWTGVHFDGGSLGIRENTAYNATYKDGKLKFSFVACEQTENYGIFKLFFNNGTENDYLIIDNFEIYELTKTVLENNYDSCVDSATTFNNVYIDNSVEASIASAGGGKVLNLTNTSEGANWPKFYLNYLPVSRETTYTVCIKFAAHNFAHLYISSPGGWNGPQIRFSGTEYEDYEKTGDSRFSNMYFDGTNLEFDITIPSSSVYSGGDYGQLEIILHCTSPCATQIQSFAIYQQA